MFNYCVVGRDQVVRLDHPLMAKFNLVNHFQQTFMPANVPILHDEDVEMLSSLPDVNTMMTFSYNQIDEQEEKSSADGMNIQFAKRQCICYDGDHKSNFVGVCTPLDETNRVNDGYKLNNGNQLNVAGEFSFGALIVPCILDGYFNNSTNGQNKHTHLTATGQFRLGLTVL